MKGETMAEMNPMMPDHIQRRYEAWKELNPTAYRTIRRFAYEVLYARRHYGVKAIIERARYHTMIETKGEPWKLNNSYTSRIARDLIAEEPRFADLFETRELRAE